MQSYEWRDDWQKDGDRYLGIGVQRDWLALPSANNRAVYIWELNSRKRIREIDLEFELDALALSEAGGLLAAANSFGKILIFDISSEIPRVLRSLENNGAIGGLRFFENDSKLLCDGTIWDLRSGNRLVELEDIPNVNVVLPDPQGEFLAGFAGSGVTGGGASTIVNGLVVPGIEQEVNRNGTECVLFDGQTGRVANVLAGHSFPIRQASYSANGKRIATSDWQGNIKIWDAMTGIELLALESPRNSSNNKIPITGIFPRGSNQLVISCYGLRAVPSGSGESFAMYLDRQLREDLVALLNPSAFGKLVNDAKSRLTDVSEVALNHQDRAKISSLLVVACYRLQEINDGLAYAEVALESQIDNEQRMVALFFGSLLYDEIGEREKAKRLMEEFNRKLSYDIFRLNPRLLGLRPRGNFQFKPNQIQN